MNLGYYVRSKERMWPSYRGMLSSIHEGVQGLVSSGTRRLIALHFNKSDSEGTQL